MKAHLPMALLFALPLGCATTHPYVEKHRDYKLPSEMSKDDQPSSSGSLWTNGRAASMLFTDARALRRNDLVVVKIDEVANAQRTANTDLTHNSSMSAEITALYQALGNVQPNPLDAKLTAALSHSFQGDGSTGRTDQLTAVVPAIVREVLPNGNLFIEGHRVVLVNSEEHHFYISGVVRPIDIDEDNSVKSSAIADAQIEFTGEGVLTDNQRNGWLSRFIGWIWPF
jgi:flagellar L-ring protein precursor FlgH